MISRLFILVFLIILSSCNENNSFPADYFTWDNATVYFLLTDRFHNADTSNDGQHASDAPPAPYRGFMGGDIKGVTEKIKEGYFNKLGVNAIWTTPVLEQIAGSVDEGTGISYPFHGYWTRDWTSFDERFGTEADYAEFVKTAHEHGIRVIMDVIINHTGPVTPLDSKWPEDWVRTGPRCSYKGAKTTIECTLVDNLPDVKTESTLEVELPPFLVEKWKAEGRYEEEVKELDEFFEENSYPRRPYYYIIKWLVDYIKKFGIDGFRGDTVKHVEDQVWKDMWKEASKAFKLWKKNHPEEVLDDNDFYMVGEVYYYFANSGRLYDYGDKKVDFYQDAFSSMINFDFKEAARFDYESIFTKYDDILHNKLPGKTVLNYVSSHDDGGPFDLKREKPIEAGTKLLLTQGGSQIYYGDESARSLTVEAKGDATLRSFMNWDDIESNKDVNGVPTKKVLRHWQILGQFRSNHPSIGAGRHKMISKEPYVFQRTFTKDEMIDQVIIGLDLAQGQKELMVGELFSEGTILHDAYSDQDAIVKDGKVLINSGYDIVLLEIKSTK